MESAALGGGGDGATDERTGEVETKLKRVIGPKVLTLFIIGDILGAGIYALVGEVGAEVGGAIWTAFLASFVLAFFTAFAYAELVSKYPRAAGAALYTHSDKAEQAGDSASLELLARAGLIAYGVVHLLIGWLAVQIAWSASDSKSATDQASALMRPISPPRPISTVDAAWCRRGHEP